VHIILALIYFKDVPVLTYVLSLAAAGACPQQASALDSAAAAIEAGYFEEQQARKIARRLRVHAEDARQRTCLGEAAFVAETNRLLDSYDPHFMFERPSKSADGAEDWLMAWRSESREVNAGVREARVLEGNLGYLRLSSFYPWDLAKPKLTAAAMLLSDTDGLVIDLRGNGGGDARTAEHLVRALAPTVESVQAIERRSGTAGEDLPVLELDLGAAGKPIAILIDRRSGSASEFVAYSLQALGRAVIVGARSGGVANMIGEPIKLDEGYAISIPDARPVNLTTCTNWEGTGVRPDVPGGDDPLYVARRALEKRLSPPPRTLSRCPAVPAG
jgi:carboxyl-terminal processing protease